MKWVTLIRGCCRQITTLSVLEVLAKIACLLGFFSIVALAFFVTTGMLGGNRLGAVGVILVTFLAGLAVSDAWDMEAELVAEVEAEMRQDECRHAWQQLRVAGGRLLSCFNPISFMPPVDFSADPRARGMEDQPSSADPSSEREIAAAVRRIHQTRASDPAFARLRSACTRLEDMLEADEDALDESDLKLLQNIQQAAASHEGQEASRQVPTQTEQDMAEAEAAHTGNVRRRRPHFAADQPVPAG
eukprot:TRINITY_DN112703_c0_g1_i1.p1 TRINITY_DN112703_c0_g1~~TRINITY_DN112703_c0_g1_i1.p1  ORF type:complete len:276 (-),score=62.22 TRINITY_DN112703_c0_g1_i1:12-746(-)